MAMITEIKDALKEGKLVIVKNKITDGMKSGTLKRILFAKNCSKSAMADLNYYAKYFNIKLEPFEGNSKQLGEVCGKPFTILMVAIKE